MTAVDSLDAMAPYLGAVHDEGMLARGQAALRAQPFNAPVGASLEAWSRESAKLRLPIRDELMQQHGFVHGGVIGYLADNALAFAGAPSLGDRVVTSEYKLNLLRPAKGVALIARAWLISAGRRQAVVRCDVFCEDAGGEELLCASGQGTISLIGE